MMKRTAAARPRTLLLALITALLTTACATPREPLTMYDLGLVSSAETTSAGAPARVATAAATLPAISIAATVAPPWLDSQRMFFRLQYANDQQLRSYASSRWSTPAADMVGQHLKTFLARSGVSVVSSSAGAAEIPLLQMELDDFSQVFHTPTSSSGRITLRAAVLDGRKLIGQQTFIRTLPAPTPDAAGGAKALATAVSEVSADLTVWLAGLPLKK